LLDKFSQSPVQLCPIGIKRSRSLAFGILVVNHSLEAALGQGLGSSARRGCPLPQRCYAVIVAMLSHIATAFLGQTAPDLLSKAANGYVELRF
jgi:hypothetical protein